MFQKSVILLVLIGFISLFNISTANEVSPEELERWFNDDSMEPPNYTYVNEGELVFLKDKPQKSIHHHSNLMVIEENSLEDGWVKMRQCHQNMDVFSRVQIVFKADRVRDIKVSYSKNIDRAWVEGPTIQLINVKQGARICVEGFSKALLVNDDGSYTLHSGPFMRRFLDGYYPMHVSLDVVYHGTGLKMMGISPSIQDGFSLNSNKEQLDVDAWFEGKLRTKIRFSVESL
ncbi:hypothetical protein MNBD_GAMMA22-953 [hydrothermal vent metagenome]|uniref:Uncharacterized protein n=1 Tax=hydrothermal vent metagenome TaxID=652676 RepID=A0A3B1AGW8_9ZZZZ